MSRWIYHHIPNQLPARCKRQWISARCRCDGLPRLARIIGRKQAIAQIIGPSGTGALTVRFPCPHIPSLLMIGSDILSDASCTSKFICCLGRTPSFPIIRTQPHSSRNRTGKNSFGIGDVDPKSARPTPNKIRASMYPTGALSHCQRVDIGIFWQCRNIHQFSLTHIKGDIARFRIRQALQFPLPTSRCSVFHG